MSEEQKENPTSQPRTAKPAEGATYTILPKQGVLETFEDPKPQQVHFSIDPKDMADMAAGNITPSSNKPEIIALQRSHRDPHIRRSRK